MSSKFFFFVWWIWQVHKSIWLDRWIIGCLFIFKIKKKDGNLILTGSRTTTTTTRWWLIVGYLICWIRYLLKNTIRMSILFIIFYYFFISHRIEFEMISVSWIAQYIGQVSIEILRLTVKLNKYGDYINLVVKTVLRM